MITKEELKSAKLATWYVVPTVEALGLENPRRR